jgi:leukotriene-A4 hydrolase
MQKGLVYTFTVITCCGIFFYQYLGSTLNEFIPTQPHVDNSTFANVDEIRTYHFHLDVNVDFDTKTLSGSNTLDLQALTLTDKLVLDAWKLDISSVELVNWNSATNAANGIDIESVEQLDFKVEELNPKNGETLTIQLPAIAAPGNLLSVRVNYTTSPESMALSWLTPEQTSGKKLPYLFSQCESINCRSIAPLQDTPSIKVTYSAAITAKSEFVVKMSANETSVTPIDDTYTVSRFRCDIPIPSYLMAIVVGDLEYRSLGDRVGVITEPSDMDRVADELESLQTLLDTAEAYLTPYIWGDYTVVVLPPSFPYGGMENPLLTFASPTIIVGDKS